MTRLLSLFMILALVMTQGTSMAAALCRHQSAEAHILARESHDARIASVSLREDAAAAASSKKASQSGDAGSHWPAELLPAETPAPAPLLVQRVRLRPASQAPLPSAAPVPLLQPPSA